MLRRLAVIFALSVGCAFPQARIPNTAAGGTLRAWFDAYNSGDRTRMEAFVQKFEPTSKFEGFTDFREATGPLELVSIDKLEAGRIEFHVKQIATSKIAVGELTATGGNPAQIVNLNFIGLQPLKSTQKP